MSLINALPFDGVSIGSSTWREFQRRHLAFQRATSASDGLIYSQAESGLKVTKATATTVSVSAGSGWANGLAFWNEASKNLAVAAAHATYTRYDYVVMRADMISKTAQLYVIQGTPAASPVEPTPDKSGAPYYDVPLALLTIAPGTGISVVSERREFISNADGIHRVVRNVSGQTMYPGHIVVWDQFSPTDVKFSTTPSDVWVAGTIATIIPNNGFGLLTEYGIGLVKLVGTNGPGARFGTSSTAGSAAETSQNYVATLLESGTTGNVVRAWIDSSQLKDPVVTVTRNVMQSTTLTTPEYADNLSANFFLRFGGRLLISFRGLTYRETGTGLLALILRLDGTDVGIKTTDLAATNAWLGVFQGQHVFNAAAGAHTAGLAWYVTVAGTTGVLRGDYLTSTLQITPL